MKIDQHKELARPSQSYRHALPRGVEIYESYMNNKSTIYEDNSTGEESTHYPSTEVKY